MCVLDRKHYLKLLPTMESLSFCSRSLQPVERVPMCRSLLSSVHTPERRYLSVPFSLRRDPCVMSLVPESPRVSSLVPVGDPTPPAGGWGGRETGGPSRRATPLSGGHKSLHRSSPVVLMTCWAWFLGRRRSRPKSRTLRGPVSRVYRHGVSVSGHPTRVLPCGPAPQCRRRRYTSHPEVPPSGPTCSL